MADKDLQTVCSAGTLTEIKIGGTGTGKKVQTKDDLDELHDSLHALIVSGASTAASQLPAGLDAPLQIEFGPAQGTVSDKAMFDAAGQVTFNVDGMFIIDVSAEAGRAGSTGVSFMFRRVLVNGVQYGKSRHARLDNADIMIPIYTRLEYQATAGDTMTFEIMRDSAGANFGGLYKTTPTPAGWADAPTAAIRITQP